jgi:hypothetical protein
VIPGTTMHRLPAALLAAGFLIASCLAQQRTALLGKVVDAVTHEPVPAASIRIMGTTHGTIANPTGQFALSLEGDEHTVIASALGYRPDTLTLSGTPPASYEFTLQPSDIILPEVVVTSEDPAAAIIRRAIARKHQWIDRLFSFTMEAFTRQVIRRDTSIASITEAATLGYWRTGDTLREVIVRRRQTANINESFNLASVGRILNFNEDRLHFLGYDFVGPTADDAFEYYDYTLERTRSGSGHELYDIRMIPRTRLIPLFNGTVSIDGDTYALAGVDVEPNEAFSIPFVREHRLRYRQQFMLADSAFWMPADIRIDGRFVVGFPGITFPPIGFEQISVISSYAINVPVPDSIFRKPRVAVDSSAALHDSAYWASSDLLPLTHDEHAAYLTLDSSKTLEAQFRPGGLAAALASGGTASALSYLDLSFNRVEGFHAGLDAALDSLSPYLKVRGSAAYGFSSKTSSASAGATVFTSAERTVGFGADWTHRYETTPGWQPYQGFLNGLTALFFKDDYYDYYRAEGWNAHLEVVPSPVLSGRVTFTSQWQFNAPPTTGYSILYPSRSYRPNPQADEGRLRSIRLDLRLGREPQPIEFFSSDAMGLSVEYSSPSLAASGFSFTQYHLFGTLAVPTFGRSFLFKPMFRLRLAAGTTSGQPPRQRYFSVETSSSYTAGFGSMRAMDVKEFTGTRYVALNLEHNFRSLPFLAMGIPFLYKNSFELIINGGIANAWGGNGSRPDGWYYEAGIGLNRIFELFRVDGTWRLSSPGGFTATVGLAQIF